MAVDIRVDQTDGESEIGHRHGEIRGEGGLAHSALAGCDREHARQRAGLGEGNHALIASTQRPLEFGALLVVHDIELHAHLGDSRHGGDRLGDSRGDGLAHGAAGDGEVDADGDQPGGIDVDGLQHADLGDRPMDLGILDRGEGGVDSFEVDGHASSLRALSLEVASAFELVEEIAQFSAQVVTGGDLTESMTKTGDLAREVVGVGQQAFRALTILLVLHAITVRLPILSKQDQWCRIGSLQGQHEREEDEGEGIEA